MKHNSFQIGVICVLFITFIFFVAYSGQAWMDLLYYFAIPLSFSLLIYGYPKQNSLTRIALNASIANTIYNFCKLVGIFEYDYEGTKVLVPSVVLLSIIYQLIKDYHNGDLSIK